MSSKKPAAKKPSVDGATAAISDKDKAQMQTLANTEDPKTVVEQQPDKSPLVATKKPIVAAATAFSKMSILLMVTVDLTNDLMQENAADLKDLAKFVPEGVTAEPVNIYNPFRGVSIKDKDKGVVRGILRNTLAEAFNLAIEVNETNVMFLGKPAEIQKNFASVAESLCARLTTSLGYGQDDTILTFNSEEGSDETSVLKFSDFIKITSWSNVRGTNLDKDAVAPGVTSNVFLNIVVNSPAFYASEDPVKALQSVISYLSMLIEKADKESGVAPTVLLGVNLRASDVTDEVRHEFMGHLNGRSGWTGYSRKELTALCDDPASDWIPPNAASIQENLLSPDGDIFYVAPLPEEAEEDAEEESEEDESKTKK